MATCRVAWLSGVAAWRDVTCACVAWCGCVMCGVWMRRIHVCSAYNEAY